MRIIDSHYHWYPRAHFEKLAARADYPRAVRDGEGYRYYFNNGRSYVPLPAVWFDLDAGLASESLDTVLSNRSDVERAAAQLAAGRLGSW